MFRKFVIILITTIALTVNASAGSDGELLMKKNQPSEVKDCFEKLNRATFAFNNALDGIIFKPVASVYKRFPSPVKTGVSNSIDNLSNLVTIPNNLLQGEFSKAGVNTGRFLINSTVGLLGLIDVASYLGFEEYEREDYGQSLAKHGVGPGCYIVLPVLGPSTARDTVGTAFNFLGGDPWYNASTHGNNEFLSEGVYLTSKAISGIEFRANNIESIENLEKNSIDFYASVRSLYLQDRENKIKNVQRGNVEVFYEDDDGWEEIETNK